MRKNKFIYATLAIVMLVGLLAFPVSLASAQANQENLQLEATQPDLEGRQQDPGGNRPSHSISIHIPANQATWAGATARTALHDSQIVSVFRPAWLIQSRIITGSNGNEGLRTTWRNHNASQNTSQTHISNARGTLIRPQFRSGGVLTSFSATGSWAP